MHGQLGKRYKCVWEVFPNPQPAGQWCHVRGGQLLLLRSSLLPELHLCYRNGSDNAMPFLGLSTDLDLAMRAKFA